MSHTLDVLQIQKMIPHRYPFLLIDRVIDLVNGESATGIKNVTMNEPHFTGHFPSQPVMPGVLIVEAIAQTAGVVAVAGLPENPRRLVYFMSIDNARFRKPVVPGDQLHIKVQKERQRGDVWKFKGMVYVGDVLCTEAEVTAMLVENPDKA